LQWFVPAKFRYNLWLIRMVLLQFSWYTWRYETGGWIHSGVRLNSPPVLASRSAGLPFDLAQGRSTHTDGHRPALAGLAPQPVFAKGFRFHSLSYDGTSRRGRPVSIDVERPVRQKDLIVCVCLCVSVANLMNIRG